MNLRIVALAAMAAFLGLAGPAHAGWKLDRARAIANIVWHNPCGGNATITIFPDQPVTAGPTPLSIVETGEQVASATVDGCDVEVVDWVAMDWTGLCTAVLHEFGHLAGFRDPLNPADPLHSHNPRSIMTAVVDDGQDARCDYRGRPFLERHGVLRPTRWRPKNLLE